MEETAANIDFAALFDTPTFRLRRNTAKQRTLSAIGCLNISEKVAVFDTLYKVMEGLGMNEHLKKVAAHHDWYSKTYDSNYFEGFALYHKITLDNIRRFVPDKGALILDAGGGTGIWSEE